jgi:hypothetical protein
MALNQLVIDIERFKVWINPTPLLDAGVRMVIVKADEMFNTNSKILASAGMPIAAYHYIRPSEDAMEQANSVINEIEKSQLPLLPVVFLDFEEPFGAKKEDFSAAFWQKYSNTAKEVFNNLRSLKKDWRVVGYTRASFVNEFVPQAGDWMGEYDWWLAQYNRFGNQFTTWKLLLEKFLPGAFELKLPAGVQLSQVVGHQFTGDELSLPGLYSDNGFSAVDVCLFDAKFLDEIGATPSPLPLAAATLVGEVTAVPGVRARRGPGLTFDRTYLLKTGHPVEVLEVKGNWARLRSHQELWVSAKWLRLSQIGSREGMRADTRSG